MRTEIKTTEHWEGDLDLVKSMCAKDATNEEFKVLLYTAKKYDLDPLIRQIYLQKYKKYGTDEYYPAQIIITRDGFLHIAHKTKLYNGINTVVTGEHENMKATCTIWNKNMEYPTVATVDFKEYTTGKNLWVTKPKTMIGKVAESQALRKAFDISGAYDESELEAGYNKEKDVTPEPAPTEKKTYSQMIADLPEDIRNALQAKFKTTKPATEYCIRMEWNLDVIRKDLEISPDKKQPEPKEAGEVPAVVIEDIPEEITWPCLNVLKKSREEIIGLWEQSGHDLQCAKAGVVHLIFINNKNILNVSQSELVDMFTELSISKWNNDTISELHERITALNPRGQDEKIKKEMINAATGNGKLDFKD